MINFHIKELIIHELSMDCNRRSPHLFQTLQHAGFCITIPFGDYTMNLEDDDVVTATISQKDARGNKVVVKPGSVTWSVVQGPEFVTATPSDDGTSCDFSAIGPIGAAVVQVDVTLANGQKLTGQETLNITTAEASAIAIEMGEPHQQA
jgi:hypothetical protein